MKHRIVILLSLTAVLVCSEAALSQDAERKIQYSQLGNFLDYLSSRGVNEADEVIKRTEELMAICPSLGGIVKQFKVKKNESTNRINEKLQRRSQLDLSVQVIQLEGTVESKTKGYLIINSNGSLIAVLGNAPIGSTYKGYVKRGDGTIPYKPLGGSNQILQTYVPASGGSPQEQYSALGKEVKELEKQYDVLWEKFKTDCAQAVFAEREKLKQTLLSEHYALGDSFLVKKEYDSALKEFSYVKSLDATYKDIETKLDLSNNKNNVVRQCDIYQIVSPKQNLYLIASSQGIFESSNAGKTWKPKAFEGKKVSKLDAMGNRVLAFVEPDGIQYSTDGGHRWEKLSVQYTVLKHKYDDGSRTYVETLRLPITQPQWEIKNLKLVPNTLYAGVILYIEYSGKKGLFRNGNQSLNITRNFITGNYEIYVGNETVTIPETCISPDDGHRWIAFYGSWLGSAIYHGDYDSKKANTWIDNTKDYVESPTDAMNGVIRFVAERDKIDRDQINVRSYSFIRKIDKEDDDQILVLTNHGLFSTCWDCDQVNEIRFPAQATNTLSVFYDVETPRVIMIGLERRGLIISTDGGLTWESI